MKQCPECLNQVVDPAIACKFCGYKFDGQPQQVIPQSPKEPIPVTIVAPRISNKQLLIISISVLLILILVVFFIFLS